MSRARRTRPALQPVIPEQGFVRVAQLLGCRRRGWVCCAPHIQVWALRMDTSGKVAGSSEAGA
jgi:hypothetical protein